MNTEYSVQNRYLALKPEIDSFPKEVRGKLYIGFYPVTSEELTQIHQSLGYKLTAEKRAEYGEEMAAKLEETFSAMRDRNIMERVDLPKLMQLMELTDLLEKRGYTLGLEDIDPFALPELTDADRRRLALPEGKDPEKGSYLVIYFETLR